MCLKDYFLLQQDRFSKKDSSKASLWDFLLPKKKKTPLSIDRILVFSSLTMPLNINRILRDKDHKYLFSLLLTLIHAGWIKDFGFLYGFNVPPSTDWFLQKCYEGENRIH